MTGRYPVHPIWFAVSEGRVEVLEQLIEEGVSGHQEIIINGVETTLLHLAASLGREEVVRLLLAAGASIDYARWPGGILPILDAAENGHTGVVRLLLEAAASLHGRDFAVYEGDTQCKMMLHAAASEGHVELARMLLAAGARVDFRLREQPDMPALGRAVGHECIEVARLLIQAGASASDLIDEEDGETLLHNAADGGDVEMVTLLLSAGARVDAVMVLNMRIQ